MTSKNHCLAVLKGYLGNMLYLSYGRIILGDFSMLYRLVANERGQSFIDGCNNDRWPNDTSY